MGRGTRAHTLTQTRSHTHSHVHILTGIESACFSRILKGFFAVCGQRPACLVRQGHTWPAPFDLRVGRCVAQRLTGALPQLRVGGRESRCWQGGGVRARSGNVAGTEVAPLKRFWGASAEDSGRPGGGGRRNGKGTLASSPASSPPALSPRPQAEHPGPTPHVPPPGPGPSPGLRGLTCQLGPGRLSDWWLRSRPVWRLEYEGTRSAP